MTEPISTTNITGLWICTRGSSFLKLSMSARTTMSRWNSETARRSWVGGADISGVPLEPVEGEVEFEHVHSALPGEAQAALVRVLGHQPVDRAQGEVADGGNPVCLAPGVGL